VTPEWLLGLDDTAPKGSQADDKDEIIRLMGKIIRLEEDRRDQAKIWDKRLQKAEVLTVALQLENRGLLEKYEGKSWGKKSSSQKRDKDHPYPEEKEKQTGTGGK